MGRRVLDWLSKITPQDAVGMAWGACGTVLAGIVWVYSFGISSADAANAEREQDRRLLALEQGAAKRDEEMKSELRSINANLVRLMVATGVQPVEAKQ